LLLSLQAPNATPSNVFFEILLGQLFLQSLLPYFQGSCESLQARIGAIRQRHTASSSQRYLVFGLVDAATRTNFFFIMST